jgi:hypothetical protein
LKRALAIQEHVWGPEHTAIAITLGHLGAAYESQGRLGEAESTYERSLAIWEKALGPNSN